MRAQRVELALEGLGDVDAHARLGGVHEPDLARVPRLEAGLVELFGEEVRAGRARVDRIEQALAGGAVVGVLQPEAIAHRREQRARVVSEHDVGLHPAQRVHQSLAQRVVVHQLAVRTPEIMTRVKRDDLRGVRLLERADGDRVVESPAAAPPSRADEQGDVRARIREACERTARVVLRVVGMRPDREHAFRAERGGVDIFQNNLGATGAAR